MASAKIATLLIRTIAKPISSTLKEQAKKHDRFRTFCVSLAQGMYRAEVRLRTGLLGEPVKHIRPLSEQKAIDNGANALAEGFLFGVAALLIIGETWRSSRSQSKRRDDVDDKLDDLGTQVAELKTRMNVLTDLLEQRDLEQQLRNDELTRILERVVEIGLRGGWAEFEDTPLQFPRISLAPPTASSVSHSPLSPDDTRIDVNTPDKDSKSSDDKSPSS
ncbi:OPA3-domain-containing protein [Guyanagaster necrorhizus]|uniref:OPA3-domain-containing protein n=1 Tax=Guyanagaster necrorhizus TaxID=856835 RepID=A0A9P7W5W3_9AGAR|nr:OPA3-domain-containing protein [Guyanagaster necrorhizus MCA 3950]KAG7453167.1 OPA3-domain-containing protein [Guyanagaster necrorhizus MCA 3950]